MILSYNEIIETLISGESGEYVPDGIAHSLPVIGKVESEIVDCFFLFSFSYRLSKFNSPIARLANNSVTRKMIYYYDAKSKPFEADNISHSYPLDFKFTKDERRAAMLKYQDSYILVRSFSYKNIISSNQQSVLEDYMNALNALVATAQKPFYYALSPDFFEWTKRVLNK